MVQPGLEPVAADEITRDLGGDVKKTSRGVVVFKLPEITPDVLKLRTTEDVYLLAWGSDSLTYRPQDLESLRKWTAGRPDWPALFKLHHAIRPQPKGKKPTLHIVCQMQGEHGYKRYDARAALVEGLKGKVPEGLYPATDDNAWLEVWLTIRSQTAVCGVRLSDKTMRHRTYKVEHVLASLRPTVAAAMVRLAGISPGMTVLDPMCGAGTIVIETLHLAEARRYTGTNVIGSDVDPNAVFVTKENVGRAGGVTVNKWDATDLPLGRASVDRIVSNPPFGKQLSNPEAIPGLYEAMVKEANRVLKPGGRAVYLVSEIDALRDAVKRTRWTAVRLLKVRVLGQLAYVTVWQKPDAPGTFE